MNEWKLREFICEIGRRLYNKGFAAANDGNITIRLNEKEILCTPTGVSKGFMKPEDLCVVDYDGKQLRGGKRRTSEIFLHLAVYKNRPDIMGAVHCHPPHATAFAIAHEPIPKCVLPEVEVFLGEVPIAVYETPGTDRFANTIVPYLKDCNTIILANHGTIAFANSLETAYFNTEILDAYCRMLLLAKQLGRVNYFTQQQTKELMEFKKRLGIDDPRLRLENCDLCANSVFQKGYSDFQPEPHAFAPPPEGKLCSADCGCGGHAAGGAGCARPTAEAKSRTEPTREPDFDALVRAITDQVMNALAS